MDKRRQDLGLRTRQYSVRLLKYARELRASALVPVRTVEQLAAAGTAIGANLSETGARSLSRRQMTHCYSLALREAREALYWLDVLGEAAQPEPPDGPWLRQETNEFIAILTVSVRNLRFPGRLP